MKDRECDKRRVSATRSDNGVEARRAAQGMRERRKEATRNAALTSDHVQWQNYASTVETRFVTKVPSGSRRADGHTVSNSVDVGENLRHGCACGYFHFRH